MGQCGCGNFDPDYAMPGPDGSVYCIQLYPGCRDCHEHRVGMIIQKLIGEEVEDWDAENIRSLEFSDADGPNFKEKIFLVLDPEHITNHLVESLVEGFNFEELRADKVAADEFRDEVRTAVREAIFKSRKDASKDEKIA